MWIFPDINILKRNACKDLNVSDVYLVINYSYLSISRKLNLNIFGTNTDLRNLSFLHLQFPGYAAHMIFTAWILVPTTISVNSSLKPSGFQQDSCTSPTASYNGEPVLFFYITVFLFCFSELLLTFFQYLIPWLQDLPFPCHRQAQPSYNSHGITVEGCVYILGKLTHTWSISQFFPLNILYWPLEWVKHPVLGAANTRTGLLHQPHHLHFMCLSKKFIFRHGLSFFIKYWFSINFLGHGASNYFIDLSHFLFFLDFIAKSTLLARTIFWRQNT